MTSASAALQWGQRGSERGWFRGGRRVLLLLEASQHSERVGVDRAGFCPAPDWVPPAPIDFNFWCSGFELLFKACTQLGGTHAQLALPVQLRGFAVGRAEPLDRLAPRTVERCFVDARAQPTPAVEEVVALLHQHLAQ